MLGRMQLGPQAHVERFAATKVCAVILSAIVACYGFMGWVEAGEWFKAAVCIVAQGLAINTAIAARRAFAKEKWGHGLIGLAFTGGFAMWSEQGLYHAWTRDGSDISPYLTWFLCASEPVLFWFTESVQLARKPKTPEEIAEEALEEARNRPRERFRSIAGGLTGRSELLAQEPARAQAKLMLRQGQTAYAVHKATGVPLTTCKRWAKAA